MNDLADLVSAIPPTASVLVIVAHPDDEILGCYGLISRLTARGTRVSIYVAHNGNQKRVGTSRQLAESLGATFRTSSAAVFDSELSESRLFVGEVDTWFAITQPDVVVTHGRYEGDHHEHRIVSNVVATCFQRYRPDRDRPPVLLKFMPYPTGLGYAPTTFVRLDEIALESKLRALAEMTQVASRPYLSTETYVDVAEELGMRFLGRSGYPVELYEQELRTGIGMRPKSLPPLRLPGAELVTTPLRHLDGIASADALKLFSEEYRVCSARADELQRLVWQVFVAIGGITSILVAGVVKVIEKAYDSVAGTGGVLLLCVIGVYFLAQWKLISSKWSAQTQAFYARINALEPYLQFRTNAQTSQVDEVVPKHQQFKIKEVRERLGFAFAICWSVVGGYAAASFAYSGVEGFSVPDAVIALLAGGTEASLLLLFYLSSSRSSYSE